MPQTTFKLNTKLRKLHRNVVFSIVKYFAYFSENFDMFALNLYVKPYPFNKFWFPQPYFETTLPGVSQYKKNL